jgi:hypothetical protein
MLHSLTLSQVYWVPHEYVCYLVLPITNYCTHYGILILTFLIKIMLDPQDYVVPPPPPDNVCQVSGAV